LYKNYSSFYSGVNILSLFYPVDLLLGKLLLPEGTCQVSCMTAISMTSTKPEYAQHIYMMEATNHQSVFKHVTLIYASP